MVTTPNQPPVILEGRSLVKEYRAAAGPIAVLRGVSLAVPRGEFLVVRGASGSGKSTLLSLLSGLDRPTSGRVILDNLDITDLDEDRLAPLRNSSFGFVFQAYHLVPSLTALENVTFPAELRGDADALPRGMALLERVGCAERAANLPHQLSGGEKQRVAICRALINDPPVLFADEPTGNLDSASGEAVMNLLLELRRERDTTLVMVTHSPEIAALADRVVTLRDGLVVEQPAGEN